MTRTRENASWEEDALTFAEMLPIAGPLIQRYRESVNGESYWQNSEKDEAIRRARFKRRMKFAAPFLAATALTLAIWSGWEHISVQMRELYQRRFENHLISKEGLIFNFPNVEDGRRVNYKIVIDFEPEPVVKSMFRLENNAPLFIKLEEVLNTSSENLVGRYSSTEKIQISDPRYRWAIERLDRYARGKHPELKGCYPEVF